MPLSDRLLLVPLNHLIVQAPWASERLGRHAGARVAIIAGPLTLRLTIDGSGLLQAADVVAEPDVRIELPDDFAVRALTDRSKLMSGARLSGAADVAETLAFVFRNLRWDAEGDLAAVIGDIPARRLSLAAGALARNTRDGLSRLGANFAEYASHEGELLADPASVKDFVSAVDTLRDDLARLDKRVERLGG
jgi:ubiquinone biosynthesis protein UbiJ